jgi:dTDP-4-dehydrorhamnose reductase
MNILVFGKDGQLGRAFKAVFDESKLDQIHCIRYVGRAECDLSNSDAIAEVLYRMKPDLLINAAAYTAVDKAETEVDLAYAINAKAPELMADYTKRHGANFLHFSTDYVFDGSKKTPYVVGDIRNPLGVYGKSKAAGEEAIEKVFNSNHDSITESNDTKLAGLRGQYAILRTSWVYGDGSNFIHTILCLAKERETLNVIADQYGVPTSAAWLAQLSLALVLNEDHQLKLFPSGIHHAVPLGQTTWHALAHYVVQAAIDAGAALKLHPDAIKAIPATEYPLPAPRPMNSRMARGADDPLDQALEKACDKAQVDSSNMTKCTLLTQSWEAQVSAYVQDLAYRKII